LILFTMCPTHSSRAIRRANVHKQTLKNESVLFDPRTGTIHSLNPTAVLVWDHCDGKHKICDITEKILVRYGATRSQVEKDIWKTMGRFHELGLVVLVGGKGRGRKKKRGMDGS
jgi:hypothetical protein